MEGARVINLKIKAIAFPRKNRDGILLTKTEREGLQENYSQ